MTTPGARRAFLLPAAVAAFLSTAAAAPADWREDVTALRVGVLAGPDPGYRVRTLEPFRVYLENRLGIPVEIVPAASLAALIDDHVAARTQYAVHSAASFVTAAEQCDCIEAVGAPVAADGALGYHSVLLARAPGPIRSLADAEGKRAAFTGADSVAGRLVPMKALAEEGRDPDAYFSDVVEADDPEAAIRALLDGAVDVAVGWSSLTGDPASGYGFGVLADMVADGSLAMDRVRVIWQSPLIPFGPHAVRSDLPADLKALLARTLGSMATAAPEALDAVDRAGYGGGGFAVPDPGLYGVMRELVAADDG